MRTLAVIPARGGSKRLPGKNIRPLCGKPLIHWSIEFARSVDWITTIEVSTDSIEIAESCKIASQPVTRLRPQVLATDEATSASVALELLDWKALQGEEYDLVALLQPTTPYRRAEHWQQALNLLRDKHYDAVVGVGPAENHPYLTFKTNQAQELVPWILDRPASLRAQDLEPALVVNGSLYLIKTEVLRKGKTFMPPFSGGVIMSDPLENLDIDTEFDLLVAEQTISSFKAHL
jgi:CMP-N,N'-diacetyllegionaminic acid synthase